MPIPRGFALGVALLPCLATAGCGSSAPPASRSPSPTVRTATPAPTPTPAPDLESVTVGATGVGTFDLATIPVAIVTNMALRHGAAQVVVHFVTHRSNGAALGSLDSAPVNLAPGETLPVAADCTDACVNAGGTSATVSVGAWVDKPGVALAAGAAAYGCGGCGGGHAHGDVTGTISVASLGAGAAVVAFAACRAAGGSIVGGGFREVAWPGGASLSVDVPVLVSSRPAACEMGASTRW